MPAILVTGMSGTGKSTALGLSAPAEVLLARIAARDNNPYGKRSDERASILRHLAEIEPRLRATATVEIDASAPIDEVVDQLEAVAGGDALGHLMEGPT